MADAKSGKTPANDHYFGKRTVEDVHRHIGGPGVGGVALVIAGIGGSRSLNQEHAATRLAPFGGHADATPGARITYYLKPKRRRVNVHPDKHKSVTPSCAAPNVICLYGFVLRKRKRVGQRETEDARATLRSSLITDFLWDSFAPLALVLCSVMPHANFRRLWCQLTIALEPLHSALRKRCS
jgi:hypothetical protein